MSRKGFITVYFLSVFLFLTSLMSVLIQNEQNRTRVMINAERANVLVSEEAPVLAYVKCCLKNQNQEDETVTSGGITFRLTWSRDSLEAEMLSPDTEVLRIDFSEENRTVYDYEVLRNEKEAP
ncbi:MAG: hypothetical protein ACI4WR_01565 [Bulleidia sp.]